MALTKNEIIGVLTQNFFNELKNVDKKIGIVQLLDEHGIPHRDLTATDYKYTIYIEVNDLKLFTKIHKVFGPLEKSHLDTHNPQEGTVWVYLQPKDADYRNFINFKYVKKLPEPVEGQKKPGNCRYVKQVSEYVALVCDS